MSYSDPREMGDAFSHERTWAYEVGSFNSSPGPRTVVQIFPTGSFATAHWAEGRHVVKTKTVKEARAGTPATA
jgi:hypothetical protein